MSIISETGVLMVTYSGLSGLYTGMLITKKCLDFLVDWDKPNYPLILSTLGHFSDTKLYPQGSHFHLDTLKVIGWVSWLQIGLPLFEFDSFMDFEQAGLEVRNWDLDLGLSNTNYFFKGMLMWLYKKYKYNIAPVHLFEINTLIDQTILIGSLGVIGKTHPSCKTFQIFFIN